ncbi:MAG: hypothetical protein L6R42_007045 [Xanthoria sp. 1 TBL-2021]|nr:MAG: hypothetical protein L6R42_007045 [Xanthoria sp. 1 TBL-2021]
MAAVASSSRPDGLQEADSEAVNEGGPSFTAVNGSNSPAPPNRPKEQPKESKEEGNRALRASSGTERPKSPAPTAAGHVEQGSIQHEQRPSPPQGAAEDRPPPNFTYPHDTHHSHSNHSQNNHSHTANTNNQQMNNGVPKRKRSYPDEYDQPNSSAYHNHALPPSPQRQRMYPQENGNGRDRDHGTPDNYGRQDRVDAPDMYPRQDRTPPQPENYPQPERHSLVRNEYDNRVEGNIAPGRPYYSEARMAEALQRENNSYDSMPMHESQFGSPDDDDDHQHAHQYGDYGGTPRTQAQRDLDRTRRKRVFSNRTKTGCMTCRRRKKKCDELHPECNNCLRGGFVCEGYTVRNTWQKPTNTKVPIPLQSKNGGYPQPMGRNGPPSYSRYGPDHGPEYPGPPPMGQGMHPSHDGERMKPILVDEDRNQDYNEGPNGQGKPSPYAKAARPYPSNPPYASKYEPGDERPASNHDNPSYPAQDSNSMHPPPNIGGRSNSVHSQYSTQSSQPPPHSNVQGIAQTALHLRPSPPQRPRNDMTERDKMLKGNYYSPFTPALTQDRENCMAAIWRFNNATNPSHGASFEERQRRFREIMACRPTPEPGINGSSNPQASIMPVGRVGENCAVEAPFHCDYGYNINIGNDVLIGADCRISDTCSVTIGDRCIFSPNVKLVCATYPIDPRRRQGSSGQALGRNIVIEEDCWIGSNVTILAGVRVGKSSTVGAGSLLHQDVPRFTVVAGNPAKVSRGIYDGSADAQ